MPKLKDLTGQRFGKLTVIERAPNIGKLTAWKCRCDCGSETIKKAVNLTSGKTKSCGCANIHTSKDEIGNRYGRLTVIKLEKATKRGRQYWLCKCDCGNEVVKDIGSMRRGKTKSCGCLRKEIIENGNMIKHGGSRSRLYYVWIDMKNRCNPSHDSAKYYGARGIRVCDEWLHDFQNFREWAYSNGYDENAPYGQCTLDRINVNGNYEPSNCRWVDMATQHRNTRRNRYIEIGGETKTIAEWSRTSGIAERTINTRLSLGWDSKSAVFCEPHQQTIRSDKNACN